MKTNDQDELSAYQIVDEALQSYPLITSPHKLDVSILEQIQQCDTLPRFRLHWFDYAISLFAAGMAGLILLLLHLLSQEPVLQDRIVILVDILDQSYLWLIILGGTASMTCTFLVAFFIFTQTQPRPTA